MRVILRGTPKNFGVLQNKIKQKNYRPVKENHERQFAIFDVPPADSDFLYELLGLGAILERDVWHDLD